MEKMHLAVFNTQPPHLYFGGVERRIVEVAKRLSDKVDTRVYSGTKKGFRKICKVEKITFIPCFSTDTVFPMDNWFFNKTISRMGNAIKADAYEAHTASGLGFLKALRKRQVTKPFILTIHGVLADEYATAIKDELATLRTRLSHFPMWHLSQVEKESAKRATLIVTVSKYSSEKIVQFYNVDGTKIRVVPNGVDLEKFKPREKSEIVKHRIRADNKQRVLFVGRLVPRKGLSFLIEAAAQVVKENKETEFIVAGDGPLKNHLIAFSRKQGVFDNFVFLGNVPDETLPALYRRTDVFALPSTQEGQGLALLEAQATGKPVVAFNVGAISESVLNRKTGLLVRPDADELADAILNLLSNESLRKRMGHYGREFVSENFSWDICAKKMFQVYLEAIGLLRSS